MAVLVESYKQEGHVSEVPGGGRLELREKGAQAHTQEAQCLGHFP